MSEAQDSKDGLSDTSADGTDRNRTSKRFENIRYWLMWRIAPVSRKTVEESLRSEVETWNELDYDSVRMVGHLLGLWEDRYFDTGTKQSETERDPDRE